MNAVNDGTSKSKCQVSLTAICNSDDSSRSLPTFTPELAAQKLLVESQLKLISQFEDRDAQRMQQLKSTGEELQRQNEEIANHLSVISSQRREKAVILREVYHRVKNNLQVVESLLKMKSRSLVDTTARGAFDTSMQRIRVLGMVHDRLYQTPDLGAVSLVAYLRGLIDGVIAAHPGEPGKAKFELDVEEIPLALDVAIPFGLLMNELLSNCLEHGLPKESAGAIHVLVRRTAKGVGLAIKDNGAGLPEGFDPARSTSMGLKLASGLAHQLGGTLQFASSDGCLVQADFTRLAPQVKEESRGIVQRMVADTHPSLPILSQA
jgi:two-component sensor histidine kinase